MTPQAPGTGVLGAVALVVLTAVPAAAVVSVTTCGTIVPPGERGVLEDDLTCTGGEVGVELGARAVLDLNGRTLTLVGTSVGVRRGKPGCSVVGGPGGGSSQPIARPSPSWMAVSGSRT